jgi:hypothetical protein
MNKKTLFFFAALLMAALLMAGLPGCSQPPGPSGPALLSIEVTKLPDKTYYIRNETFDPAGIIVTAYFDNDDSREVADYEISIPPENPDLGEKTVIVSYQRKKTGFSIFVEESPLEGIVIATLPAKTSYAKGEDFDPEGLVVEGVYPDGQRPVSGYTHDFDSSAEGTLTVTLTLNGFTADFEVIIGPATLVSIEVTSPPKKIRYAKDEQFLREGLVISGTYTDNTVKPETDYRLSGTGTGTVGEKTVTVTLERDGKTLTTAFPITVSEGGLLSITIARKPNKTVYLWHEELDLTGLEVKGRYSSMADLVTLPIHPVNDISGYDKTTPGEQTLTVTVEGLRADFTVTVRTPRLYFDYGRRISELDPPIESAPERYTYTLPAGRSLVLAPVKSGVIDEVSSFVWKVDGVTQSSTGEYLTVHGNNGTATVTVALAGLPESEITTYVQTTATEGTHKRPITDSSRARASEGFEYTPAPGQFVGGIPRITNIRSATEETVRQDVDIIVKYDTSITYRFSLGAWGGYVVMGFDHSVINSGEYDLSINGNAFGGWNEPGIVWVSQDDNGNGKPDDTWYELKGSETGKSETIQRYSLTYYKAQAGNGPNWEDNLGNTGIFPSTDFYGRIQGYPSWVPGDSITLTGTRLPPSSRGSSSIWGYVDCVGPQYYRISDAIQQDGSPIHLQYIDFVKVQCGVNDYQGVLGEISTETGVAYDASMPNPDLLIQGADAGNGQYSYQFINSSGYDLGVTVEGQTFSLVRGGGQKTITLSSPSTYFSVSGGSVTYTKEVGKITFSM